VTLAKPRVGLSAFREQAPQKKPRASSTAFLARAGGVGHPGFVAFAAVAPTVPPFRSRKLGGSTSGGRGGNNDAAQ
jgi:hypothetical protein